EDSEDLPPTCLFSTLVQTYKDTKQLIECETKERQKIQNANTNTIRARIKLFEPYFPELNAFQNKLEKHIICEKHYNQIFVKDTYLNYLKNGSSYYPRKRSRNFNTLNLNDIQIEPSTTIDIGIQVEVDNTNSDLLMQIGILKNSLNVLATENSKQSQIIEIKNNKIYELEYECEYLKKQIADFNLRLESLNLYKNNVEILTNEKNKLENENTYLKEQWNERLSNKNKQCLNCFESEIDNKKRNCPKCNTKLPTLASISQASSFQQTTLPENIDKTVVFKLYEPKQPNGEINLSEEIKSFSVLAQEKRQVFIKHTLMQNTSIDTWRAIPVTEQEAEIMKNESTMRKEELISVINSILISLPETQRSKYTNLKNKTKTILLTILQEIRGLNNAEDAIDEENEDKELIDEEMI
ncbi:443_t:CDS:2, partial [Dentiscutata heterogama]